ncbi:alpha-galactosidase [Geosporobacter subterraneus DSM 17957]|uniref:Alpha-galactosidase n=1 Tax=Geosporobacter subterraneus DSM 17957 TaxID=1121919 RepID=A0A1M6MML1_9FIRM|nr:alpha-galactosidase [Geosporobacter subterraneus]SHJ84728.1 alpha-galactosidase [Geosporobacter subterraneus DSM 17957]
MGIKYHQQNRTFHLQAGDSSYIFQVYREGYLAHLYWGKRIRSNDLSRRIPYGRKPLSPTPDPWDEGFSLDTLPQEYPAFGNSDFRNPAYQVQLGNGSTVTDLRYKSHKIFKGKKRLQGLPATYVESDEEAESLEVVLCDELCGLEIVLTYTVFEKYNVLSREARLINRGKERLKILKALSGNVDFLSTDYDFLHLSGSWGRERHIERRALASGTQSIESRRGSSSHQQNPFAALLSKGADEKQGEVFAFSLVYSGNFTAQVEVDQFKTARFSMGINPFDFSWMLDPMESFQTPELVMVYSDKGLGDMSSTYHQLYRNNLCRGYYKLKTRPVLINNWEATYFDFTPEKLENIAKTAAELGLEMFVLDDGWFGKRNRDDNSLGDWIVNKNKLPKGLEDLTERINHQGLSFGLWFEPEMISEDSDLYRAHPDWCIHVPDRRRTNSRHQLILDLTNEKVRKYIIESLSNILGCAPIRYVKWDMNRNMTEVGSAFLPAERQRETAHRYMLGLYEIMDKITADFPEILFESCSGGGGRFDPGILHYMPQTWTSDNTDAIERLFIQYGTSLVYPPITMGAHVSAVPNHQVERITDLRTRGHAAMSGNLGYELDLTKLSDEEKKIVKEQIGEYKEIREIIQFGQFYRLKSPFEGKEAAWMFVSDDKQNVVAFYFRILAKANPPLVSMLRLRGLDEGKDYELLGTDKVYGGDELIHVGINIPSFKGDYVSHYWRFKAIK